MLRTAQELMLADFCKKEANSHGRIKSLSASVHTLLKALSGGSLQVTPVNKIHTVIQESLVSVKSRALAGDAADTSVLQMSCLEHRRKLTQQPEKGCDFSLPGAFSTLWGDIRPYQSQEKMICPSSPIHLQRAAARASLPPAARTEHDSKSRLE